MTVKAMCPVSLKIDLPSRSFSTRRLVRHLASVREEAPYHTILSLNHPKRNARAFVEVSHQFAIKLFASHARQPFPFTISLLSHPTVPMSDRFAGWVAAGASIHLLIEYPKADKGIQFITALWLERKKDGGEANSQWPQPYQLREQSLPQGIKGENKVEVDVAPATEGRAMFFDEGINDKVLPSPESR
jgi:hypothetical protein